MKKLVFLLFIIILFLSCTPIQNDFYGTWLWESNDRLHSKMEYVISLHTINSTYTDNSPFSPRSGGLDIISWNSLRNEDINTKYDFPTGFMLELRYQGQAGTQTFFISNDKKRLLNNAEPTNIYQKQ